MTKTKIELTRELGRSMAELRSCFRQYIQVKLKEHNIDMTFEMLEVMSFLWAKDGINQQELADKTLRDKSAMTYLIDNLVKRSVVIRVEDDNDRRNKLIYLTSEGKELQLSLRPWVSDVFDSAAAELNAEHIESGICLLNKMVENLRKN